MSSKQLQTHTHSPRGACSGSLCDRGQGTPAVLMTALAFLLIDGRELVFWTDILQASRVNGCYGLIFISVLLTHPHKS